MVLVAQSVLVMFAMIAVGFIAGRRGIVKPSSVSDISALLIRVTLPCTVFSAFAREFDGRLALSGLHLIVWMLLFCAVSYGIGLLTWRILRIPEKDKGVWLFVSMLSNTGFMGFPMALSIYGEDGLFLMTVINVISNFLIFSVGVILVTRGCVKEKVISVRNMVLSNINISVAIGLICYLTQVRLPTPVLDTVRYIGNVTTGLSMMVVGLSLSRMPILKMFKSRTTWLLTGVRLLLIPILTFGVIRLTGISALEGRILMLTAALPSASAVNLITEQYGIEESLAPGAVCVSTLLSLVTIPVMLILLA